MNSVARSLQLRNNTSHGADDLNAFYSAAEILAYPSLNEGFGLPILEAYASGTPVVTSNITSMPEIAGDAALIINPEDTQAIADAMYKLLSDAGLRGELSARGLERAKEFTWRETARKTAVLYQSLSS